MKEKFTKKSAVDLTDLAIGIVVLGIVVAIGSSILIGSRDSRLTDLSVYTTTNEKITANNVTAQSLAKTWFNNVVNVTNSTGGELISTGNYTTSVDAFGVGKVLFSATSAYNGTTVNATYNSYNTSRPDWQLSDKAAIGLGEYGNWFKIIVIVGVAAVILALVFAAFGRGRSEAGVSY